jgi:hypothetical protein
VDDDNTQYGIPHFVQTTNVSTAQALRPLLPSVEGRRGYSERWLQELVARHPSLLPIDQIEPNLSELIPVCMELPTNRYVDNLYVTREGDLVLVEAKLYRNPEARREVIGQVIEYAKDLSELAYEDLDSAVKKAERPDGSKLRVELGLFNVVQEAGAGSDLSQSTFVDAVSRNLQQGRFVLLIVADGIHSSLESITNFVQRHMTLHFRLALVDLAVYESGLSGGGYFVQPRVVMKTTNIARTIITLEPGKLVGRFAERDPERPVGTVTTSISQDRFYEQLEAAKAGTSARLKAFVARLQPLRTVAEFGKGSLILRWRPNDEKAWNMGAVTTSGALWTDTINGQAQAVGQLPASHQYLRDLADSIPGAVVKKFDKPTSWYVSTHGTYVGIDEALRHQEQWIAAMSRFMETVGKSQSE